MRNRTLQYYEYLKSKGLSFELDKLIGKEMKVSKKLNHRHFNNKKPFEGFYDKSDFELFLNIKLENSSSIISLQTLDDLLEKDKMREADGFPRRIKIGKYVKPIKNKKEEIVVVPTTTEPKFYHDNSITEDEESTGGSGDGEEGEVIAEQEAEPEEGEGEGNGAGQGQGGNHEIGSDAFDLGKVLTEQFQLPNLKTKGNKRSITKFQYDLTDRNRGFGQVLDKKATIKRIIQTNILLGRISENEPFDPENLLINPNDQIFRILSKEKDYESQAVVFFIRDYSGSMQGKPTEVIATQHLFIYSWLMFQYQNNVTARFILHDTDAKEVPDFYTYYKSQVAGGTSIFPAYELVNKIVETEQLAKDNNIYIFHGTDGDDWEENGEVAIEEINKMLVYTNRMGITIAKNAWSSADRKTIVENYLHASGLLEEKPTLIKLDAIIAEEANENRIIEGIKKLIS